MKITATNSRLVMEFDGSSPETTPHRVRIIATALSSVAGVSSVHLTWYDAPRIVATHRGIAESDFLRQAAAAMRAPAVDFAAISTMPLSIIPVVSIRAPGVTMLEHRLEPIDDSIVTAVRGFFRRCLYGGLACVAFGMAWIGLLVPGIPTIPFVILTVYFADQASPLLRRYLLFSPVLGPAMRDWRDHRAIRRSVRIRALVFTGVLLVVTLSFAPPAASAYVLIGIMSAIGVFLILRVPVIRERPAEVNSDADYPMTLPLRFART